MYFFGLKVLLAMTLIIKIKYNFNLSNVKQCQIKSKCN